MKKYIYFKFWKNICSISIDWSSYPECCYRCDWIERRCSCVRQWWAICDVEYFICMYCSRYILFADWSTTAKMKANDFFFVVRKWIVVCARKCTKEIMSFVFAGVWLGAESKKSLTSTPANVEDIKMKNIFERN